MNPQGVELKCKWLVSVPLCVLDSEQSYELSKVKALENSLLMGSSVEVGYGLIRV